MPFPSPPWTLQGDMWLSLFRVGSSGTSYRPPGLYGAAFVDYREGSVLTYRELLVARVIREGAVPRVRVVDIWVDSTASRDGGRALWALPKELAHLHIERGGAGPVSRTSWDASLAGGTLATARATGVRAPAPRTPLRFGVSQEREDRTTVVAGVAGSARVLPWVIHWDFPTDGPLWWLRSHRPLVSLRMTGFQIRFGE
ncbi:MAG TPA: acetoacetate decarboxylase family protein [Nocardioidaceae bacterium]|nr:acetoacetate decarboxylase family protein [Nocardioidaceae bacterium]